MEDCKVPPSISSNSPNPKHESTNDQKEDRKLRVRRVKNSYVDLDSVTSEPGTNYCDWIQITKQKLKEREEKQTRIAIQKIESIVNAEIKIKKERNATHHHKMAFVIPQTITKNTFKQLFAKIDAWDGVKTARLKAPITRYRKYFGVAKNWYIQMKRKIFGDLFWVHVLVSIQNLVQNKWTELHVVHALFDGKLDYSNTKPVSLINGGTVIHSNALHNYLFTLHHSLQVKQWIREQEMCGNWRKKAEAILMQVQSQLQVIIEANGSWQTNANQSKIKTEPRLIQVLGMQSNTYRMPQNNNNALPPPIMLPLSMNNNNHNNVVYGYIRGPSHNVSDTRSSPLLPMNAFTNAFALRHEMRSNSIRQEHQSDVNKKKV
eukprot:508697_1